MFLTLGQDSDLAINTLVSRTSSFVQAPSALQPVTEEGAGPAAATPCMLLVASALRAHGQRGPSSPELSQAPVQTP